MNCKICDLARWRVIKVSWRKGAGLVADSCSTGEFRTPTQLSVIPGSCADWFSWWFYWRKEAQCNHSDHLYDFKLNNSRQVGHKKTTTAYRPRPHSHRRQSRSLPLLPFRLKTASFTSKYPNIQISRRRIRLGYSVKTGLGVSWPWNSLHTERLHNTHSACQGASYTHTQSTNESKAVCQNQMCESNSLKKQTTTDAGCVLIVLIT